MLLSLMLTTQGNEARSSISKHLVEKHPTRQVSEYHTSQSHLAHTVSTGKKRFFTKCVLNTLPPTLVLVGLPTAQSMVHLTLCGVVGICSVLWSSLLLLLVVQLQLLWLRLGLQGLSQHGILLWSWGRTRRRRLLFTLPNLITCCRSLETLGMEGEREGWTFFCFNASNGIYYYIITYKT